MQVKNLLIGIITLLPFFGYTSDLKIGTTERRVISWQPVYEKKYTDDYSFRSLAFKGANFDDDFLPFYSELVRLDGNSGQARAEITNVVAEPLNEKELIRNIPKELIHKAHHWLILHGRYTCLARSPKCLQCGIRNACIFFHRMKK